MSNENVYRIMQEEMVKKLEEGVVPWRKSWNGFVQMNAVSKRPYRGFNIIWLACQGQPTPYWLTFKQCKQLKGKINKGAKSTVVLFWKVVNKKDNKTDEEFHFPVCRYYRVWNLAQTEGITVKDVESLDKRFDNTPIENCDTVIASYKDMPEVLSGNPAYSKGQDKLFMPALDQFESSEEYYSTMFHELGHSTMHPTRLNRNSENYAKEELIAEMTACFLCGVTGIDTQVIDNQASYIATWMKKIKEDASLVVLSAGAAQKASDYILNNKFDEKGNLVLPSLTENKTV